jgi:hypothetical protein
MILRVVLHGYETSSLIRRKGNNQRLFENRVLRKLLSSKQDEVLDGWRNMHEEFSDF